MKSSTRLALMMAMAAGIGAGVGASASVGGFGGQRAYAPVPRREPTEEDINAGLLALAKAKEKRDRKAAKRLKDQASS